VTVVVIALTDCNDAAFHVLARQPVVALDDSDHGNIDLGDRRFGSLDASSDAKEQHEHRHHHERVSAPQHQPDNPTFVLLLKTVYFGQFLRCRICKCRKRNVLGDLTANHRRPCMYR
jgi:hypothetical protein